MGVIFLLQDLHSGQYSSLPETVSDEWITLTVHEAKSTGGLAKYARLWQNLTMAIL